MSIENGLADRGGETITVPAGTEVRRLTAELRARVGGPLGQIVLNPSDTTSSFQAAVGAGEGFMAALPTAETRFNAAAPCPSTPNSFTAAVGPVAAR